MPNSSIPAAVKEIAKGPVRIIYDAISTPESQKADLEILEPDGSLVLTLSPTADTLKDDRWVVQVFGVVRGSGHSEFGKGMYAALPGLLADGSIKVCCLYGGPRIV